MLIHGLLYKTARYVALRGKNQENCVKKKNICISVYSHLIETNIGIYQKNNKRGKVIYFSQHIFRGVTVKCAEARF